MCSVKGKSSCFHFFILENSSHFPVIFLLLKFFIPNSIKIVHNLKKKKSTNKQTFLIVSEAYQHCKIHFRRTEEPLKIH